MKRIASGTLMFVLQGRPRGVPVWTFSDDDRNASPGNLHRNDIVMLLRSIPKGPRGGETYVLSKWGAGFVATSYLMEIDHV